MAKEVEWEDSETLRKLKKLVEQGDEWNVVFRTFYAGFVEFGTGPSHEPDSHGQFMPPLAPILGWVEAKLGYSGDKAKSVAYAVREKIHEAGAAPHPFARPAVYEAQANLARLIETELSLEPVMEYIAKAAKDNIARSSQGGGPLEEEVYLVHGPVQL